MLLYFAAVRPRRDQRPGDPIGALVGVHHKLDDQGQHMTTLDVRENGRVLSLAVPSAALIVAQ